MNRRLFRIVSLVLLLTLAAALIPATVACGSTTIGSGTLTGPVNAHASNVPEGALITISIQAAEGGCNFGMGEVSIKADGDTVFDQGFLAYEGHQYQGSYKLDARADNLTVSISVDDYQGPVSYAIKVSYNGSSSAAVPPDHRINWHMGDDIAAIFPERDADGSPELHVYEIGEEGKGDYRFIVTLADLQPYLDNPPASHTEIKSAGKAALYALDSGEFQISLGPNEEGKIYDLIFTALPVESFTVIQWSVYDVIGG